MQSTQFLLLQFSQSPAILESQVLACRDRQQPDKRRRSMSLIMLLQFIVISQPGQGELNL